MRKVFKTTDAPRASQNSPVSVLGSQMNMTVMSANISADEKNRSRAVWLGRILVIVVLSSVAAILGYLAHHILTDSETDLAEAHFTSIADRALEEAVRVSLQRRWSAVTMATVVSEMNPNAEAWPFVTVTSFERIVKQLLAASSGRDMGFAPIVPIEQLPDFEDFAYDFFDKRFPNQTDTVGISSFGKGAWGIDRTLGAPDNRYHDVNGTTKYGSPNKIATPILHTDEGVHPLLMFNVHFQKVTGDAIDDMIECSRQRAARGEVTDEHKCGIITPIVNNVKYGGRFGATIMQPIYPANNRTTMTGFIPTVILFDEVLEHVFADQVDGIDCVLETETQALTYTVKGGIARLVGEGDLHQTSYDKYRRFCSLTATGLYTENSPTYKLSLYPNDELYAVYSTNNPTVATIGAVCIILITSMVFFLYDFFVRREFHAKKELLRAKRQFMRFVSHEVRTPLNSVCMGLTLIMEELEASIGYDASSAAAINNNQDETVPLTTNTNSTQQGNAFHGNKSQWFLLAKEIQTNAQGAVDVLNDLLNYDKIEQGTLLLELTILPIWQLIAQAADEFKLPAAMKKLNFEMCFNVPEEHAPISSVEGLPEEVRNLKVIGDAVRLTQVLRNLISNALKFTPEGGSLRVQASWVNSKQVTMKDAALDRIALKDEKCVSGQRRGHLQVTVEDSGAGMSQDQLAKLFRDGVQFNANELQAGNGTGLGLYIAKGIVEQHQGNLVAVSEGLQQGTTFTMTLPFWHIPEIECSSNGVDTDVSVGTGTLEPIVELAALRVLIVDDASSNRKLLNRLLSNGGHICDEAENGAVAVDMVARAIEAGDPYDTVLLDYEMPVMRGPEAAKELRRVGSDVYIVGITGNMLPEDVAYFKSCGANAVLPKPFKIAELTSLWMEFGLDGNSQRV